MKSVKLQNSKSVMNSEFLYVNSKSFKIYVKKAILFSIPAKIKYQLIMLIRVENCLQ